MNIKIDSRKVKQGDTFIAIKEINHDGHDYINDAILNGATTIIAEYGDYSVNTIIVDNTKKYLEEYLENNYYEQIKDLKLIGITGTNGKTTTSYLIYQALNNIGIKCAYIGTLGFYMEDSLDINNTTPNLYELYNMLIECKKNNYEYVVMEVSSQGIAMGRINTLIFDYAIFTNLTQDHLDYHKTMEVYLEEKQKLFSNIKEEGIAIINNDDLYKDYFLINNKNITYGKNNSDYNIEIENITFNGTYFKLNNKSYFTKLVGVYNIYNISSVIILLELLNIDNIDDIIKELNPPKGRLELIKYKDNNIIIDYAHTPDAVFKVINEVSKIKHNRIITIIGCGGNRDKSKRKIMGEIATSNSSFVIFTSDNPRYEKPKNILKDITCKLDKKNYKIIVNRKKAIKRGIQMLEKNDILLLLGKGHEDYQIIKNKKYPFSDKNVVLKYIRR